MVLLNTELKGAKDKLKIERENSRKLTNYYIRLRQESENLRIELMGYIKVDCFLAPPLPQLSQLSPSKSERGHCYGWVGMIK